MKDLIKAQLYQISKTRVYLWVFLFFIGMSVLFGSVEYMNGESYLEEGQLLTASSFATRMGLIPTLAFMGMGFFTAFICLDDFSDKTCNHEITSGRMRKQAYFARAIISVTASVIFGLLMVAVTLITSTVLVGWGDSISVSTAVTRILLLVFPFFRISCFFVLLSYILKKPAVVAVTVYAMMMTLGIISEDAADPASVLTAFSNIAMLNQYDAWYTFGLESGANAIYEPSIGAAKIILTIIVSLAAGGAYLALGYSYFHGDDLE